MVNKEFINELKNPWFWVYIVSLIILVIIFNLFKESKFLNIGSLFLLSFVQLIYGAFQIKASYNQTFFQKYISLGYGIFLLIFSLINLAIEVQEPMIALSLLFSYFGLIMLVTTKILFTKLWDSKTLVGIIFFYLLFSFSLNYMFAFGYTIVSVPEDNSIVDNEGNKISGALDYVLFSYSIFYNSVLI